MLKLLDYKKLKTLQDEQLVYDKAAKDANSFWGLVKGTISGLPNAGVSTVKNIGTGLKEQFTNPSAEQKNYEATILPYATTPILKTLTTPGVKAARLISRFLNPGLQPLANNLAEIKAINEKGGIVDQVASGKIPPSVLDEFAVLHKKAPQIVGDVAQAVLTAYAGGQGEKLLAGSVKQTLKTALATGAQTGLEVGTIFGASQALSSGSKNPLEILGTVGTTGAIGGVLGAITSGAIPVSKEVLGKVKEAKVLYDSMTPAERQSGKIKNPFSKPIEAPTPPKTAPEPTNAPKVENPLAVEARKYKSAEEFVKGQTPRVGGVAPELQGQTLYRGMSEGEWQALQAGEVSGKASRGGRTFLTTEKQTAEMAVEAGKGKGVIVELKPEAGQKVISGGKIGENTGGNLPGEYQARNIGIDDIAKVTDGNGKVIYEATTGGKTKSQLTDIWNKAVGETKKGIDPFIRKERGFVTSIKEALPEIKVAGQYVPRSTDRLSMKAKNLVKEDITTAEKMAFTGTDDSAVATGAELLKHYADQATKATNEAVKNALYDKAAELGNTMARKLTELGKSVQAASILARLTPEGQVRFAAREIQKYNEQVAKTGGGLLGIKKQIPEITGEQAKFITDEMNAIGKMGEGTEKAMRFQKLQDFISNLVPTPLFKKIIAVWKAGLLTGIKTTGVNIFANTSHFASEIVKDIPATIIDKTLSLFTGKRTKSITLKGSLTGGKEGFGKGLQYFKTGFDERNVGTKLDYVKVNFGKGKLAKGLQAYTDTVFRLLGSEDQPLYYASKLRSLYEQAKVGAINKGLKGKEAQAFIDNLMQNPTDEMIKYASIDAETAVFQNQTALSEASSAITKKVPATEVIMPFRRTPSAVAMQILNYSPAGAIKTIFENVGKGRFDQRNFSQSMGRALTGTAVLALGALLYKKGMITTSRPVGEKEQKLWELEGKQPNSIKINGKWRQVQVLGPLGNVLLIGGSFQKAFDNSGSPTEAMAQGLADASKSFTQQTFLTGVSNFIDAVSDPARSASYVAGSTLASTIPTIVADTARATDKKERRANEIFEKLMARIPGVRETLEPQVNVLGQEKGTVGNPLEIMADPTRPSPSQSTPVIQELRRLWDKKIQVSPTLLGDKNGYKGLTAQQNTELWKKAGEITNAKLTSLFLKDEYQKLPDDEKGKLVEKITDKSKLMARVGMVIELTQGLQGEELKAKLSELKKSGLMTNEVFNNYLKLR